jgi:hypothetical protein
VTSRHRRGVKARLVSITPGGDGRGSVQHRKPISGGITSARHVVVGEDGRRSSARIEIAEAPQGRMQC